MTTVEPTLTYSGRMTLAEPWERDVLDALWLRGWTVQPIGSGQLNGVMRDLLRRYRTKAGHPTLARWVPDICAAKDINGKVRMCLLDAKAGDKWRETGNHDIEVNALVAAEAIEPAWGIPVLFVFQDWSAAATATIRNSITSQMDGVGTGRTPFYLFPRTVCTPFDSMFGTVTE